MDAKIQAVVRQAARNEITEYFIYKRVAAKTKNGKNREVLEKIANQERGHYDCWSKILGKEVPPSAWKIRLYTIMSSILGLSFSLKLMEKGEGLAQVAYLHLGSEYPQALGIMRDEQQHEKELLTLINERFLQYVSSFVLGLNDALVELTGALAGLTLALNNTKLIAMVGLITGIAASLSMMASEYLSAKEEAAEGTNPLQASIATGIAYTATVALLIAPYLFLQNAFAALGTTLVTGILIILCFTFYTSVARGVSFRSRFLHMASISLGVALLNFFIGYGIRQWLGVE